ncbi:gamma-butyrobetaine dioxygenase [Pseudomonas sp. NPDC078700]|uniref:gamma-butyrobetaine dioxygenase n=1 Tax=Pseudomonas sp. NPDC078700 TaxID=3364424 RepID=UPI0037C947FC
MSATQQAVLESFSADWRDFPVLNRPVKSRVHSDSVEVEWDDDRVSEYHFLWLRDNCPCPLCVHPGTREQVFEIIDVPEDLQAEAVELSGDDLHIRWQDGHESVYGAGWLRAHSYDEASRDERLHEQRTVRVWKTDLAIPRFDYQAVMSNEQSLLQWLLAVRDTGLALMTGMPTSEDILEQVAHRISFIRESNFGSLFEVRTKVEAVNSNAYTSLQLPPHTDLPTRELQPGLQFLHCLVNDATGGESTFVDGFAIAQTIREQFPEDFTLLTQVPVSFRNKAPQSDYRSLGPIIGLDARGEISEIRLANWLRAPFDLSSGDMTAFYRAYRRFFALTRDPAFIVSHRLAAGEMWCFDNRRTMHARNAFDQASGMRHLRGCYMDRDELLSRILVLQRSR